MKFADDRAHVVCLRHSPHGECGLKFQGRREGRRARRHSPHGECGLKYVLQQHEHVCARHSPHGECGLKFPRPRPRLNAGGHSPHGECGLKCPQRDTRPRPSASLPAWGVRVEIGTPRCRPIPPAGHSPHGECGLKSLLLGDLHRRRRHSPHGECGLKFGEPAPMRRDDGSLPAWGVRVEIILAAPPPRRSWVTPRMGSAG